MDRIRDDLLNVNWNVLFFNLNVSEMTFGFTDIFSEIMSKHITHKMITCNDKDAPWITPQVKTDIKHNSRVYRKWANRGRNPQDHDNVRKVQNEANNLNKEAELAF